METLDKLFRHCAQVNKDATVEEQHDHVLVVRNILKYPEKMFEFQKLLSKWESRGNAKPGIGSLHLPYWTANYIGENWVSDLEDLFIEPDASSCEFYYFYYNNICIDSETDSLRSNNCVLPHTDPGDDGIVHMIGLINLNQRPVRTGFWKFNGEFIEHNDEISNAYNEYALGITPLNYDEKVNNGILDKAFEVEYGFNDAIFYDARIFHNPIIDTYYTRENPRVMLRLSFKLVDEPQEECYYYG